MKAVAAAAPATKYELTLADGTDDAANWSTSPNPATAGQTVTIKYNGSKKVKSIKAVKKAAVIRTLAEATAEDLGKIAGADGNIYDTKADAAWLLPSQNQWKAMFKAFGDNEASYSGLNAALAAAGGDSSKLQVGRQLLVVYAVRCRLRLERGSPRWRCLLERRQGGRRLPCSRLPRFLTYLSIYPFIYFSRLSGSRYHKEGGPESHGADGRPPFLFHPLTLRRIKKSTETVRMSGKKCIFAPSKPINIKEML